MIKKESGQIFIVAIVVISVILINTVGIIAGALLYEQNSRHSIENTQAINLAEAGVDKAIASLNSSGGTYSGDPEVFLVPGSFSVSVTSSGNNKIITATGYIPSKSNPRAKRTVKINASKGVGTSFKYGVQVGEGGMTMGSNNTITGSIYSNGNVTSGNKAIVTGDIWVAGGTQPSSDQATDCKDPSCADY